MERANIAVIMRHIALALLGLLAVTASARLGADGGNPDAILGRWLDGKGRAVIEITRAGDQYVGKIVWLKEPAFPADDPKGMAGRPRVDRENPDPALRSRPLLGLEIMRGFVFDGWRSWSKGRIYDPQNGKTYGGKMTLVSPDVLSLRGFVVFSIFGRTEQWKRVK